MNAVLVRRDPEYAAEVRKRLSATPPGRGHAKRIRTQRRKFTNDAAGTWTAWRLPATLDVADYAFVDADDFAPAEGLEVASITQTPKGDPFCLGAIEKACDRVSEAARQRQAEWLAEVEAKREQKRVHAELRKEPEQKHCAAVAWTNAIVATLGRRSYAAGFAETLASPTWWPAVPGAPFPKSIPLPGYAVGQLEDAGFLLWVGGAWMPALPPYIELVAA